MRRLVPLVVLFAGLSLVGTTASAKDHKKKKGEAPAPAAEQVEEEAEEPAIVDYRDGVMHALGAHMGAMKAILKGEVDRSGDLAYHAAALHGAASDMGGLFPEGTGKDTRALPDIWEKPEEFATAISDYEAATAKLVEVVASGDQAAAMGAFGEVGKSCGGCHKPFRADDD